MWDEIGKFANMPLYRCPECGWATTASWVTTVRAHRAGCPECAGSPLLVANAGARVPSESGGDVPLPVALHVDRRHMEARRLPEPA